MNIRSGLFESFAPLKIYKVWQMGRILILAWRYVANKYKLNEKFNHYRFYFVSSN
jgi:hypothetical protein